MIIAFLIKMTRCGQRLDVDLCPNDVMKLKLDLGADDMNLDSD